jgi:hypothetical protein
MPPRGPEHNQPELPQHPDEWQEMLAADLAGQPYEAMQVRAAEMPEYYDAAAKLAYEGTADPSEQRDLKTLLDGPTPFRDIPEQPSDVSNPDEHLDSFIERTERWAGRKGEAHWQVQLDPDFKKNLPDQLRSALDDDPRRMGAILAWKKKLETDARELGKEGAMATARGRVESADTRLRRYRASHDLPPSEASRPRRAREPFAKLQRRGNGGFLERLTRPPKPFSHSSRHQSDTATFMADQRAREDFERGVFRNEFGSPTNAPAEDYIPRSPEEAARTLERTDEQYHASGAQERAKKAEAKLVGFNALLEATPDVADELAGFERNMAAELAQGNDFTRMSYDADNALTRLHHNNYPGSPADHEVFAVLAAAEIRMRQLRNLLPRLPLDDIHYAQFFDSYTDVSAIYNRTKNAKDQQRIVRARERGGNFNGRYGVHYQPDKGVHDVSGVVTYPDGSFALATSTTTSENHVHTDGRTWQPPTPVNPATFEIPKGLPHVVEARYHDAIDTYNADYYKDPAVQARAQVYAAEYSRQVLEAADALPKGDLAADRDSGNVAAYYAHYLANLPGEKPGNDEVRPFGDVLVNDATYYGKQGTWNIRPDGTMTKLRRDAAGALVVEKMYDPHGKTL